jgi:hypothetical protein
MYGDHAHNARTLVALIADPDVRETQTTALNNWLADAPGRSTRCVCPGCALENYNRKGRLCAGCMEDIIRSKIAACQDAQSDGEPLTIESAAHWNNFPFLAPDTMVDRDAPFFRTPWKDEGHRTESATSVLSYLMTELGEMCLTGFKSVPAGVYPKTLFGGGNGGDGKVAGTAPKGFGKLFRDLAFFIQWVSYQSHKDGFEQGQNLLASLASGTMTHEDFEEKVASRERQSMTKSAEAKAQKMRY